MTTLCRHIWSKNTEGFSEGVFCSLFLPVRLLTGQVLFCRLHTAAGWQNEERIICVVPPSIKNSSFLPCLHFLFEVKVSLKKMPTFILKRSDLWDIYAVFERPCNFILIFLFWPEAFSTLRLLGLVYNNIFKATSCHVKLTVYKEK